MKTILSRSRWIGVAVVFAILGYFWSQDPVVDPEVGDPIALERSAIENSLPERDVSEAPPLQSRSPNGTR